MEKIENTIEEKYTFEVRDLRNGEWYWIHKWVVKEYGQIIKSNGIAVYNVLSGFSHNKTQKCWPSLKAIGDLIGMSRETAKRTIKKLIELELIKRERFGQYHYIYYLLKNPKFRGVKNDPSNIERGQERFQRGQKTGSEGSAQVTNNNKEQELKNKRVFNFKKSKQELENQKKAIAEAREKLKKKGILQK